MRVQDQAYEVCQVFRLGVLQRIDLDDRIRSGRDIELLDELGEQPQVVVVVGNHQPVGALIRVDRGLVRKHTANPFPQFPGLNM